MAAAENIEPVRLTRAERITLVDIARQAILNHLTHSSATAYEQALLTDSLRQRCGAFISLHIGD